jgi:14-3-3 protein epsilon
LAGRPLSADERELLSVSYKRIITGQRKSLGYLASLLDRDDTKASQTRVDRLTATRAHIIRELDDCCADLIALIDGRLLPASDDAHALVFYHKLTGDYLRYVSEFKDGPERLRSAGAARDSYENALQVAREHLHPWAPAHLGVVLNYSVCLYEVLGQRAEGMEMAQKAEEDAGALLDNNSRDSRQEAVDILHIIRENIELWADAE